MPRVLIVEDNVDLSTSLDDWLTSEFYFVEKVFDGIEALSRLKHYVYDVIILDWELPGCSGIEVLKQFRRSGGTTPILMLSVRCAINDKELGFESGLDDYLVKPFEARELSARLKALMRRHTSSESSRLKVGVIELDTGSGQAFNNGELLDLAPQELSLLEFFLRNPRRLFSIDALIERVWNGMDGATAEGVRASIGRLRKALKDTESQTICTVHRLGYRFEPHS